MSNRKSKSAKCFTVQKARGVLTERVQAVGPDRFGIVVCDCAKARFKLMLADYYGTVRIPPTEFPVTVPGLRSAVEAVRAATTLHALTDVVVAVEQTGEYHRPVSAAWRAAGFEVRVVHPHVTKQYRQAADPGNKTDDTDLMALHRAAVAGFATAESTWPTEFAEGRQLVRHRRDLVVKTSKLRTQCQELLHAMMPGFAANFDDLWRSPNPMTIVRKTGSPQAVLDAGRGPAAVAGGAPAPAVGR